MVGKSVSDHSFSKKEQVTILYSSLYVSVEYEKIEINPQQLYQRLLVDGIGIPSSSISYVLIRHPCLTRNSCVPQTRLIS